MMTITPLISEFIAIGQLQDITIKSDGKIKYLLLSTDQGDYSIKVAKDQPKSLGKKLQLGCKLKVKGMLKQKVKRDKAEYKAYSVELLDLPVVKEISHGDISAVKTSKTSKTKKTKAKVLICKKSNCWNKGGKEIYKQLVSELKNQGITEQVEIKTTGCLKKCKKAPNMVVLPDKEQYVRVKPKQIPVIVGKHLS